ncbi:MAG: hypothetical protein CMF51_03400 [Legionellales bacterium]|mgnify:CR=1 FL=1|nr:hypothetical protein [Legionellales bacterium]
MSAPVEIAETLCFKLLDSMPVSQWACITDTHVEQTAFFKVWWQQLSQSYSVRLYVMPAGESFKNQETKTKIECQMLADGLRRQVGIIAVGGGVVLDVAGFIAQTFCRGVPWISYPTSWMAMVDVCIGGKTGINTPFGKNTLGAIYPAQHSVIHLDWLKSLPMREYQWACSEVVKMGLLSGEVHWRWLSRHTTLIQLQDYSVLNALLQWVLALKWSYVQSDLKDQGRRKFLNLGHTLAHAIEQVSTYRIPHGPAVAWGLCFDCQLSIQYLNLNPSLMPELIEQLARLGALMPLGSLDIDALIQACYQDKKNDQQGVFWIGLSALGQPSRIAAVEMEVVKRCMMDQLQYAQSYT